jgi:hypothetical protein
VCVCVWLCVVCVCVVCVLCVWCVCVCVWCVFCVCGVCFVCVVCVCVCVSVKHNNLLQETVLTAKCFDSNEAIRPSKEQIQGISYIRVHFGIPEADNE